ncbi:hypothetical protein Glove_209g16 [Diversispora epigaea]|uniref:Uncharacterized protein n=1 Tax=Diversispora epigaea TaxID=1348612 RepID=A0A397ILH6_9GLOM|nr:hypothetical protein Glove_209g16 [Diversispora epigaea]
MFSNFHNYFTIKSYQTDMSTSCLEPWEKALFHSLILISITLFIYTIYFLGFSDSTNTNYPENVILPLKIGDYHSVYL